MPTLHPRRAATLVAISAALAAFAGWNLARTGGQDAPRDLAQEYAQQVRPLVTKYCLECHSTKVHKGDTDLERFATHAEALKDLHTWEQVADQVEAGEMPPKGKPQPSAAERKLLAGWARGMLEAQARAKAGDPGPAVLRRLNNAEYAYTLRDLTGVDLDPAREFPADGAAGEGFTNTGTTLVMSPALIDRYLKAGKEVAAHAVLLPDGFRFSPSASRRDWTNEALAAVRKAYAGYPADGKLPLLPYVEATLKHRAGLKAELVTLEDVAAAEKVNPKYLRALWEALTDLAPSHPLDRIRAKWQQATPKDAAAIVAEVTRWQAALWKTNRVGSYVTGDTTRPRESLTRQSPEDPPAVEAAALRLAVKPAPGQADVVLTLTARDPLAPASQSQVVWRRPRFEAKGKPARLLRDYANFGPAYEVDYATFYQDAAKYLEAVADCVHDKLSPEDAAKKHALDPARLKNWIALVALQPVRKDDPGPQFAAAQALTLLDQQTPKDANRPAIGGWRSKGADLPIVLANSSDKTEMIPGTMRAHRVAVHPTPKELVGVVWKNPQPACSFRVSAYVSHVHPACGNGVAWWLEHRRGDQAVVLAQGTVDLGKEAKIPAKVIKLEPGDSLALLIDARNGDHVCDLTEVGLSISADAKDGKTWDLAGDVADSIAAGNPHADSLGNKGVWSFVKGPARPSGTPKGHPAYPAGSLLARWRDSAADPARRDEAGKLAAAVQVLLTGPRPKGKDGDTGTYDALLGGDSPLVKGLDAATLPRLAPGVMPFGLAKECFSGDDVAADGPLQIRLPAAILRDCEFVVDGALPKGATGVLELTVAPVGQDGVSAVVATPGSAAYKRLLEGHTAFRRVFPLFLCFPRVVPEDETVSLKMFHREDEALVRLFLDKSEAKRLDRLWAELRFVSRQPAAEYAYLPQFMEYTTQDTPKELQQFFIDKKPWFKKRAEDFEAEEAAAAPAQLQTLGDFAARAYRRPLRPEERKQLLELHAGLRKKGLGHDEAFRAVLTRVLVSPHFLYRIETPAPGVKPAPVSDWELASRLSYFLWASQPDDELRSLAEKGELHEPKVLKAQAARMLQSPRVRGLATEFGMQWLQVRDILQHREKSEKLFPTFDDNLRRAFFEEAALLFEEVFRQDLAVPELLGGDFVFVNETLAKHYGLSDIKGPQWRKLTGARKLGRGGVLTLSAVLTKQAGASRTSPVLRGNWVVQTLLGEKLPRPPADVPQLPPGEETGDLTVRQLVVRHVKDASCAKCHVRIDPYGFAMEGYDPIGRRRVKDLAGRPVDDKAELRDGVTFAGVDGLRQYLLEKRRDDFLRTFCRKLLGYALGRSVLPADQPLLDEMLRALRANDYRVSAAVLAVVESTQFRYLRGAQAAAE